MKAKYQLLLCIFILCLLSQDIISQVRPPKSSSPQPTSVKANPNKQDTLKSAKITFQIIEAPQHTHGYDIFVNNKLTIHQTTIPGYPGMKGFSKKSDATKVAQLVVEKIKAGQMPPTVTKTEIEKLIK